MILSKNNFKSKPVNFSNLIDELIDAVHVAMSNSELNDDHFADVYGTEFRNNETDEVLCKVTMIDILNAQIWIECADGIAIIPLNILG